MTTLLSKSIYRNTFVRVALLSLMAFCGVSSPVLGQETLAGQFKLADSTRFGNKFLPAGAYTFAVVPVGLVQSVGVIQGAWQPVVMLLGPVGRDGRLAV